jgi:hypothetical protein
VKSMMNVLNQHASRTSFLPGPVMNILSVLALIDAPIWLESMDGFQGLFFDLSIANPNDQYREAIWNAMSDFFTRACRKAYRGGVEDPDRCKDMRRVVKFLWDTTIKTIARADSHVRFAGKAFESAGIMLR